MAWSLPIALAHTFLVGLPESIFQQSAFLVFGVGPVPGMAEALALLDPSDPLLLMMRRSKPFSSDPNEGSVRERPLSAIRKLKRLREAMRALDVDEERGILTAYGERFLFMPLTVIHSIEDRLTENLGPVTATSFQYEIGKEGGREYIRMARNAGYDITKPRELQKIAERLGTLGGWGKLQVSEVDLERRIIRVRWTNGVSVRNRKGKTPVCHFGRGILTGCAEVVFRRKCESLEVSCQGKGDPFCEAVIGDPAEIVRIANSHGM